MGLRDGYQSPSEKYKNSREATCHLLLTVFASMFFSINNILRIFLHVAMIRGLILVPLVLADRDIR